MGTTHAIDYVCPHLARVRPEVLTIRMWREHHRTDFEGPFFSALLISGRGERRCAQKIHHR
jgi:hypothetical protein